MRQLLHVSSLLFILATAAGADPEAAPRTATAGVAATPLPATPSPASEGPKKIQSPPPEETKPKARMSPAEIQRISDEYFKQCMQDWDPGTHMTKKDWERTCRRVVDNRVKFIIEQTGK